MMVATVEAAEESCDRTACLEVLQWPGNVNRMRETKNKYTILVWNHLGKFPPRRPMRKLRWILGS
jgi:hypothetical protein